MSKRRNKIIRKIIFSVAGTALGGALGKYAADGIEAAFEIGEKAGDFVEVGLTSAGALGGTFGGEALENAIWSENPPSNPEVGTLWYKETTRELYMWTGVKWQQAKT